MIAKEFYKWHKNGFPEVRGAHELKTRSAGDKPFIQFHLEMDGNLSLLEAHNISDQIAAEFLCPASSCFATAVVVAKQLEAGHINEAFP